MDRDRENWGKNFRGCWKAMRFLLWRLKQQTWMPTARGTEEVTHTFMPSSNSTKLVMPITPNLKAHTGFMMVYHTWCGWAIRWSPVVFLGSMFQFAINSSKPDVTLFQVIAGFCLIMGISDSMLGYCYSTWRLCARQAFVTRGLSGIFCRKRLFPSESTVDVLSIQLSFWLSLLQRISSNPPR